MGVGPPVLRLSGVSKTYASNGGHSLRALREVSMEVGRGEFVSLVGPSGCGKSTLLGLIAGLEAPTDGAIEIAAETDGSPGRVAYMPQRDLLLPWRSLLDNATLGAEVGGGDRAVARRRAQSLLPSFGLEGFADALPHTLSGGMRQRAALLRTVLLDREILLLDEPFGALDALTRAALQEWLLDVWERLKAAVLFVTHDVEEALWLSDRVYVMSRRPGSIQLDLAVDLPRPRTRDMRGTAGFAALKQRLLDALLADTA
ncbi:MAG: ABC transporter ATP-binding protein [Chloroflexota bacterium]|nr:ABC transporter ATP-binding protein [Chloroflexota bacterium]MDE2898163.1 ABC transporter ATP-binding protein [Chloroflexota bacterium]